MISNDSTASFLDKTDWRRTIHKALEDCVRAEGTEYYPKCVRSLISAFAASYPNFDAGRMVYDHLYDLQVRYSLVEEHWLIVNSGKRRWQKYLFKKYLLHRLSNDMFEYIKNLCARKRMLLWGTKTVGGGTQMEDDF